MNKRILFATSLSKNEMEFVKEKMNKEGYTNKSKYIRHCIGIA